MTGYPSIDKPWLRYYPPHAHEDAWKEMEDTIYNKLYSRSTAWMDNYAIEYFGTKITYKGMFKLIDNVANALVAEGIGEEDACMLCLPNIPEVIYFVYAINKIGGVACLIDPRTNSEGILERALHARVKLLVVIEDIFDDKIKPIIESLDNTRIIVCSADDSIKSINIQALAVKAKYLFHHDHKGNCLKEYGVFLENGKQFEAKTAQWKKDRPAVVVYTSGTTGSAKGVVLTNENINGARNQHNYVPSNSMKEEGKKLSFLGVIAFFSSYGFCCGLNGHLSKGWTIICIPKFKPSEFGKLIVKYEASNALGVPRFWEDFARCKYNVGKDYLKNPICGGDKILPTSIERINDFMKQNGFGRLKVGYGASEFAGAIVVTTDFGKYDINSVGEPLPGVNVMVMDPETGKPLKYGETGELCFSAPSMMAGYLYELEETQNITVFDDGGEKFYRTGDKGYVTAEGQIYMLDRYKRAMMRPDGHTVHATPIENVILKHPSVKECAVAGLAMDGKAGVIPVAFVVLVSNDGDYETIIDEIDALCTKKLPERDKAHAYVVVDKIPYTPMGKVDYEKLEKEDLWKLDLIIRDHTFI